MAKKKSLTLVFLFIIGVTGFSIPYHVYAGSCDAIIGKWTWFTGSVVTIHPDGTMVHEPGNDGTWECSDASGAQITMKWRIGGYINSLALSADGQGLSSRDPSQSFVTATRIGAVATADDDPQTRTPLGHIPSLNAKVTALRFFETPYNAPPKEKREYSNRFAKGGARYVGWELNLEHPTPGRRVDFPIEQVWYRADGSVLSRQTTHQHIEADWIWSYQHDSYGWKNPGNWPAGSYRVDLYVGGQKAASGSFKIYHAPNDAIAASNKGADLFEAGKYSEAIPYFDRAIRLHPNYAEAYNNRCAAYGKFGEYDRAISDCTEAIRIEATYANAYRNRAAVYVDKGQYDQAIADSTEAIELNPNLAIAYVARGISYDKKGEHAKALDDFNKAQTLGHKLSAVTEKRLDELRKASQTSKQPPQKVTPEDSEEITRLIARISSSYKDTLSIELLDILDDKVGSIHRGLSVTYGEGFALIMRSLHCGFRAKDYRTPRDAVEDCDKKRNGLEWTETTSGPIPFSQIQPSSIKLSESNEDFIGSDAISFGYEGYEHSSGVDEETGEWFFIDSPGPMRIECKDRSACEQTASDLKKLVELAQNSAAPTKTSSPELGPKTAEEPRPAQSDSSQAMPRLQWKFEPRDSFGSSPIRASPTVADGVVYVSGTTRELYAIDTKSGQEKWAFQAQAQVSDFSPAVADGVAYVCDVSKLYAVDIKTGRQLWKLEADAIITNRTPAVADGAIYFGAGATEVIGGASSKGFGVLIAVDSKTGRRKLGIKLEAALTSTSPAVADGVVYVGGADGHLYAVESSFDSKTRRRPTIWTFKTGGRIDSSPAVADGVVYVGSNDSHLYAVDIKTHQEKWRFKTGAPVRSSPAVADGVVYVGSDDSHLYAVDAKTGREKWIFKTGGKVSSSPAIANGVVYVGSHDTHLYAVDAKTGRERWRFKTGDKIFSSPAVADGVVYVGSDDGYVYAIK